MSEMIPLDKIDDSVITAIRNIKKDDETYKLLESAIKKTVNVTLSPSVN